MKKGSLFVYQLFSSRLLYCVPIIGLLVLLGNISSWYSEFGYEHDFGFLLFYSLIKVIPIIVINIILGYILSRIKAIKHNKKIIPKFIAISFYLEFVIYGSRFCYDWSGTSDIVLFIFESILFVVAFYMLVALIKRYTHDRFAKVMKNRRIKILRSHNIHNVNEFINHLLDEYSSKPTDFEGFIAALLTEHGYHNVKVTPPVNDRGKDITAVKDNNFYVIEVKLYQQDHKVGREKIQKLHSAMIDSNADRAIFITTSDFAEPAKEYANKFNIEMINGQKLYELYITLPELEPVESITTE